MTEFAKIDIKEIKSDVPRSNFSEEEIDQLADLLLQGGGVIRPLVLKLLDVDSYIVLDGHFEYHAAVRAREKDPRRGEMVNALVISSKNEKIILKQIEALRGQEPFKDNKAQVNQQGNTGDWINSFEKRLSEIREELFLAKRDTDSRFQNIEKHIAPQEDLLKILNTFDEKKLSIRLSQYGVSGNEKLAGAICDARKQKKTFDDYRDVVKSVRGLGDRTMLSIIDGWSRIGRP